MGAPLPARERAAGEALTFAVPDLHGRADLLDEALGRIGSRAGGPTTIVFLGDYVGKGGDTCGVLSRLIAGPDDGSRWICLKGNHEAMMLDALDGRAPLAPWLAKGGTAILESYPDRIVPPEHRRWLRDLPNIHVDERRVFVHAGVDPGRPLDAQDPRDLLWKRYDDEDGQGHGERFVVHGHRPSVDGPRLFAQRIDLDTLAWATGRLVVGVFENRRTGPPVELLEVGRSRKAARASAFARRAVDALKERCGRLFN